MHMVDMVELCICFVCYSKARGWFSQQPTSKANVTFQRLTFDPGRAGARGRRPVAKSNVVCRYYFALEHIDVVDMIDS